jgi:pyruvate ferredoxin oxidoreductase gamma subunit
MRVHKLLITHRMAELTEIRIDGRGGQGNVVAAYMLAQAAFEAGRFAQAFPSFGPERRGAPVAAFVRIADRPIRRRCQVREPLYIVVQDPSLLHVEGALEGLRPGGGILINSPRSIAELGIPIGAANAIAIPATAMATQVLGEPIPNTALLASLLALTDLLPLAALEKVLAHRFEGESLQRNLRLMREAAARVPPAAWKEHARVAGN